MWVGEGKATIIITITTGKQAGRQADRQARRQKWRGRGGKGGPGEM